MTSERRAARGWILRLIGLGLVAFVLFTQLSWQDALETTDGRTLEGHVSRDAAGDWHVEPANGGEARRVPDTEVARRGAGGDEVPAVTWGIRTLVRRLSKRPLYVAEVLVLLFLLYVLTGYRWHLLLRAADVPMALGPTIRLNLIGSFFNLAVPGSTGGDVVKAWYAARATRRGVRAVLSVFADRLIGLVGLAVFATVALLFLPWDDAYASARLIVLVALVGLLGGCAVMLSTRVRRLLGVTRIAKRLPFHGAIAEASGALRLYRERPATILGALLVSLVNHAVGSLSVWLLARALGIPGLSLPTCLALVPIANLFSAIPLLPGGWGVGELAFAYLFGQVGVPATEAVSLSIVFRLCTLVASLPGGILWLFWRGRPTLATIEHEVGDAEQHVEAIEAARAE